MYNHKKDPKPLIYSFQNKDIKRKIKNGIEAWKIAHPLIRKCPKDVRMAIINFSMADEIAFDTVGE